MFEQELREEQRSLQSLSNEIRQIISRYDTRMRDLRKQFDKVNGTEKNKSKICLMNLTATSILC